MKSSKTCLIGYSSFTSCEVIYSLGADINTHAPETRHAGCSTCGM